MKELVCKMCNSNEISLKDGMYVCESCGTKYTADMAENLSVEVTLKNDNSDKINTLMSAAKKAKEMNNWEAAAKYYDEILGLKPDSWEATFYSVYCTAMTCKIIQISSAARLVNNSLEPTYKLIKSNVPAEQMVLAVTEVTIAAVAISKMLKDAAFKHYCGIDNSIAYKYEGEMKERCAYAILISVNNGIYLDEIFGDMFSEQIIMSLKEGIRMHDIHKVLSDSCVQRVLSLLGKYDPDAITARLEKRETAKKKKRTNALMCLVISIISAILGLFVFEKGSYIAMFFDIYAGLMLLFSIIYFISSSKKEV